MKLQVAGEGALMLYLGDTVDDRVLARVQAATTAIENALGDELVDLVPSYASVLILFNPLQRTHAQIATRVREAVNTLAANGAIEGRLVVLPVLYGPDTGADLPALASRAGLSIDDVVELHTSVEYRVYAIGFAPGFAYLGQVDARIAAPRLATPRQRVPRGSVAIADRQTAVYPADSPGGWNLLGRCPLPLFDPAAEPPMPVTVGDRVRFEPVGRERFLALGGVLP